MTPATIALIIAGLAEATKYGFQLAELIRKGNAGELTEDQVLAEFEKAKAEYAEARAAWDDADQF